MDPASVKITTETLVQGALVFFLLDAAFVSLLAWRIKPARLKRVKWPIAISAAFAWTGIWLWAAGFYWDAVYTYVFPEAVHRVLPFLFGLGYALVALICRWVALRLGRFAAAGFCLSGGLVGMGTHAWAVSRGIVEKPPMLQGASPVMAVVIACFEFIFYWCAILSLAWLIERAAYLIGIRPTGGHFTGRGLQV